MRVPLSLLCREVWRCKEQVHEPGPATRGKSDNRHEPVQPGGPPVKVVLDGGALVNWFVAGGRSLFASVPSAIQELVNGNPVQIAANRAALANPATESTQGYGLTYGVFCSEWIPFEPQSEILAKG